MMHAENTVIVDGATLTCETVTAVACRGARVALAPDGLARAAAAHRAALAVLGATRSTGGPPGSAPTAGCRSSRATGTACGCCAATPAGRASRLPPPSPAARWSSGSTSSRRAAPAPTRPGSRRSRACSTPGLTPQFPVLGAIGTGDLTGLAATALALIGERPWRGPGGPVTRAALPAPVADAEALSFLSSNAVTLAQAVLAHQALAGLLDAELAVAALSHLALSGSAQPYAEPVQAARPHPGQGVTARRLRDLLGQDAARPGARVQDPYGLRALPQVHGPAVDALGHVERVLRVELNAAAENPLVDTAGGQVLHNGNFHGAYLGLALDGARLAVCADAALSPARLAALTDPDRTGLRPFLADGPEGSSGIMILEYTASAALSELRGLAAPASLGTAVLSRGAEEHAAFSPQAARAAAAMAPRLRTVLACELVAAVRALRQRGAVPASAPLRALYDQCLRSFPAGHEDRPLDEDVAAAEQVIAAQAAGGDG